MGEGQNTEGDLASLRFELAAARDGLTDDSGAARARFVNAACGLAFALVEDLADDEADAVLSELQAVLAREPRLEIAVRRHLAAGFTKVREHDRATTELRRAHRCAVDSGLRELATELESELGRRRDSRVTLPSAELATVESEEVDPEVATTQALERSRAAADPAEAERLARESLEHAYETVDPEIVATSLLHLAELLEQRGALAEAKALLEQQPPTRDSRPARALYDHIRRRLGEPVPEPPDEPDQVVELPPPIRAYFTRPTNLARAIMEGWLPGESHIREWATGTVASPADLDSQVIFGPVRSFHCECGRYRGREYRGLTCQRCGVEIEHASVRRTRVGLLVLPRPILHPWYAPAAATLLGLPIGEVLAEPAPTLRDRLASVDLAELARQFKQAIVTAPKARLADEAGRKLALVDAFSHAIARFDTTPASLVLDVVLVAPPDAPLGRDAAARRSAYARVFTDAAALTGVFDVLA